MARRSLERRLVALESARTPKRRLYWIDIGEPDVDDEPDIDDGERVTLDAWPRRYAGVVVDIGASVGTNDDENRERLNKVRAKRGYSNGDDEL
jgi:hypothetical protein